MNAYSQSLEAKILARMEEPFAMGLLEERNAPMVSKHARGIRRYLESINPEELPCAEGSLYPSGAADIWHLGQPASLSYHYSFSIAFSPELYMEKQAKHLTNSQELAVSREIQATLQNYCINPLSPKYCVGGNGYTHSILHYRKILTQGLPAYGREIQNGLHRAKTLDQRDFYAAMQETYDSLMAFLQKCTNKVISSGNQKLSEAMECLSERPPSSFYEAMVLLNFMYYVDGCDSIGNLDTVLSPFFVHDFEAGMINEGEIVKLLSDFLFNVNEHSGWHMILGNRDADERLTVLCLKAMKFRRPNAGLKITATTGDAVWNAAFDCLADQTGNPAFYNDAAYRTGAVEHAGIKPEDLDDIAYGGCTEFMVAGKSNVGSTESGINLLEILDGIVEHILLHDRFDEILRYRCYRGNGFLIPSVIMFTTFVAEGKNIRATPDGRMNGSPIADSCGPMQGTDVEGPTSMLASAARLPQSKGLGTMVLNLRVLPEMVNDPPMRLKFMQLLQTYFDMGGLQLQASVADAEMLKCAQKHPEQYSNLVIRIGGYTEYFHRLNAELQQEVIKRSEN